MTMLKVLSFTTAVLLVYTVFANVLPQVQSDPPEEENVAAEANLDMPGMIAMGEKAFNKTCTLCHNDRGRAPDLLALDLSKEFPSRLSDANYKGIAKGKEGAAGVEAYIRESLLEPSAFVVPGFGKKGTNDSVSPMPVVNKPPISFSEIKMNAVIAFLQDRAGLEPTVPLPTAKSASDGGGDGGGDAEKIAATGEEAINKFGCSACHDLLDSGADTGPDLHGVGERLGGKDGVRRAIMLPNDTIAKGFDADVMPNDFSEQMRVSELNVLVDYLVNLPKKAGKEK